MLLQCMIADKSVVIDMSNKEILFKTIKDLEPDFVVPEIEALSIEALKELEMNGFNIIQTHERLR